MPGHQVADPSAVDGRFARHGPCFLLARGCSMTVRTLAFVAVGLAAAPLARGQDDRSPGRVRLAEGGVMLQRASEASAEEAVANVPFLPGDRVWTDGSGRGEFQFAGAAVVRLDRRSKLDYVAHDEGRDERIELRLWSGGLYLHTRGFRDAPDVEVETPGGVVSMREEGVLRIDAQGGETRLSVYEGEAALEAGRRVQVRAGERVYAAAGEDAERPEPFDRSEADEFASWDEDLEREAWAEARAGHLPDEIAPYGGELEAHGAWYYEADVGHVWRPYVSVGWQPYTHGRWAWTAYGWTWVPSEPWGWVPSHYGRWGHSASLGWYWIPGRTWGPAWVSWSVGGNYVGWCPLGYRDRPVIVRRSRHLGHAVPRGSVRPGSELGSPWVYARRGDLGARDLARRRLDSRPSDLREARTLEPGRARLTRDLRVVEGGHAAPRAARTRPTIGDSVPELRQDPATSIPFPAARRGREREDRSDSGRRDEQRRAVPRPKPGRAADPVTVPADVQAPGATVGAPAAIRHRDAPPRGDKGGGSAGRAVTREEDRRRDPDRDVLRPLFRPLTQPRPAPEAQDRRGSDRGQPERRQRLSGDDDRPRQRAEPAHRTPAPRPEPRRAQPERRREAPPPPPPSSSKDDRAVRRKKNES